MKTATPAAPALWQRPPLRIPAPEFPAALPKHNDRPWPTNEDEIDLPDAPASAEFPGQRHDRHYLGSLLVQQQRVHGRLSLDVDALTDALCLELGPYRLDRHQTAHLLKLLTVALALLGGAP